MKVVDIFEGISVSTGIGMGNIHIVKIVRKQEIARSFTSYNEEKRRLIKAVDSFCYETYTLFQKMRNLLGQDEALILGGQIYMARDLEFVEEMYQELSENLTAEEAVTAVFQRYLGYFMEMEDEVMSQRAGDLRDMRDNILNILHGQPQQLSFPNDQPFILCVDELSPSLMSQISAEMVAGILCEKGGITSHCAILARATGIPAIFSVENLFSHIQTGDFLVVDASCGKILRNPQQEVLVKYQEKYKLFQQKKKELEQFRKQSTKTAKGISLSLYANISNTAQIHTALELGADGVGLFRTEYLFLDSQDLPSEEQQLRVYLRMAKMMHPRPVSIRTLDIGGDKVAPCIPVEPEENPFLGQRALRFCFCRKDIFETQIRAILRASAQCDNISLLVPFIIEVDEIQEVVKFVRDCRKKLKAEGVDVCEDVPFGVVVETPSAAILVDLLCKHVEYISVGTNDLTQYLTVADRGNLKVASQYNPFNLSVLRILRHIIQTCNRNSVPITLCGEVVSDPRMVPLLLGFGKVNFSVSPSEILSVRRELYSWSHEEAKNITESAMLLETSHEIETYLNKVIQEKESVSLATSTK